MVHAVRVLHWLVHAMETAFIAGLIAYCFTRELGAEPLAAFAAAGGAFMAVSMAFAAYLTATGAIRAPDSPVKNDGGSGTGT
ncbi:hypothetical protein AB0C27_41805 [Nonomuraea sp. NPDC048882]|uniref:hypothetical protein n=1 Tax=unclassified Nonomuraea TaxID=2593643 RepID=UPI0034094E62